MSEYMAYKKDIRKVVSGDTLASISEQVLRLERDLKTDQDTLTAFQRRTTWPCWKRKARSREATLPG